MIDQENRQINDDEISLKDLILKIKEWLSYLWSKKLIIILAGVLGGALGLAYSFIKKPVYTATTTFVLEDEKSGGGLGSLAGLASMAGVDLGGGGGGIFQGDNLLQLYKSRTMIVKTLLSPIECDSGVLLMDKYIAINQLRESWSENPKLKELSFNTIDTNNRQSLKFSRLQDSILGIAVLDINNNYLSVSKPDKKLSIIKVDVKANDEEFAKAFNNRIVQNVNTFYKQTKTKKSLDNIYILQYKTDSVRAVMNGDIYTAAAIADATPNLNPTHQVQRVAPIQRSQFSAETNKAILAELVKNLEMSKMNLLIETPLIQVIDEPIFPLKKDKFGKFKGVIIGGVLLGIVSILALITRRALLNILK